MQAVYWWMAGAAAAVTGFAALADRRRTRRRDIDRVGWVPWPAVLLFALFVAVICAALALRGD